MLVREICLEQKYPPPPPPSTELSKEAGHRRTKQKRNKKSIGSENNAQSVEIEKITPKKVAESLALFGLSLEDLEAFMEDKGITWNDITSSTEENIYESLIPPDRIFQLKESIESTKKIEKQVREAEEERKRKDRQEKEKREKRLQEIVHRVKGVEIQKGEIRKEEDCPTCLEKAGTTPYVQGEKPGGIFIWPCGHKMCIVCFLEMDENNYGTKRVCPLCRQEMYVPSKYLKY